MGTIHNFHKVESKNAAGNVISAFGYALDATGNRTAMDVILNGVHNHIAYEFDAAYRLTRETRKDAAGNVIYDEGLTYDPVGNRLTRNRTQIAIVNGAPQSVTENTVYAYNNANQLLTETTNGVTTAYGYDKNGNNTTISTPAANGTPAKTIAMTYDWLNRQTKWTDGERTESTVFAGADWKRASTTVSGAGVAAQTVKYLYDGDNVLADCGNDNAMTAFYVTPGLDQNLSVTDASGQTAYYTQDGLGSVRLLTSTNGAILNRYDYTAFGEAFAPNTVTTAPNRYTYTAREQSPLAAHGAPMCYRWRNYAPQVGRFGWRDPIGYRGGVNVYGYVEMRTNLRRDPKGLQSDKCCNSQSPYEDNPNKYTCCKFVPFWKHYGFDDKEDCYAKLTSSDPFTNVVVAVSGAAISHVAGRLVGGAIVIIAMGNVSISIGGGGAFTGGYIIGTLISELKIDSMCEQKVCNKNYAPKCNCGEAGWFYDSWKCKCDSEDDYMGYSYGQDEDFWDWKYSSDSEWMRRR